MGTSTWSNSIYVDPIYSQKPVFFCFVYVYRYGINSPLAWTPEFSSFLHVTPRAFMGIIRADTPCTPSPPVRTAAVQ